MKQIKINGIYFELKSSKYTIDMIEHCKQYFKMRTIEDIYKRPSIYKIQIWQEWHKWFVQTNNIKYFEVQNGSCFSFTIHGILYDDFDYPIGYIKITKEHNYLYVPQSVNIERAECIDIDEIE